MKPVPTTGGDCDVRITAPLEKDVPIPEQGQAIDREYLPMDVYIHPETRQAHFHFTPKAANRRKSCREKSS